MDKQTVAAPSGTFDFLGLPSELRNQIYELHLSEEGEVDYISLDDTGADITSDIPVTKPDLGVNILRVCRQVYDEAVPFVYAGRSWNLGRAPAPSDRVAVDCAQRLTCIPDFTIDRIENIKLDVFIDLKKPTSIVTPVVIGDLRKMKSLQTLELWVELVNLSYHLPGAFSNTDVLMHDSPLLFGLVCQILSQVPVEIEVLWTSWVEEWPWDGENINTALKDIAHKFRAIQGCNCTTGPSSTAST